MAKRKEDMPEPGAPLWMATFGDMMNLLLCFFVLLFSMSTVDAEKFELMITSLQSSFSILPHGGSAVIDGGSMISSGVSQLEFIDSYFKEANSASTVESDQETEGEDSIKELYEQLGMKESEKMEEEILQELSQTAFADVVEVHADSNAVTLTLNGTLLFDSGKAEIMEESIPLTDKLSAILDKYAENKITIEGHTDNVPISNNRYKSNYDLSYARAMAIRQYVLEHSSIEKGTIHAQAMGEDIPIADNSTWEGRARNRRVEIVIHNSY